MKIERFNEKINTDDYNNYAVTYTLYGEFIFSLDKYKKNNFNIYIKDLVSEICTGSLEYVLRTYHEKKNKSDEIGSFDNFFFVKKEIIEGIVEKDELEKLLKSKKYNI